MVLAGSGVQVFFVSKDREALKTGKIKRRSGLMIEKIYKPGFDKMRRTETCGYLLAISTEKHTNIMREPPPLLIYDK